MGEFNPGNKTIYVVFDEESDFSGPRTPKLSLDQVFYQNRSHFGSRHLLLVTHYVSKPLQKIGREPKPNKK